MDPVATPPHCSCVRHLDDALLGTVVPGAASLRDDDTFEPMSVGELVETGSLEVRLTAPEDRRLPDSASTFTWDLWAGDEVRGHYDDDAELELDAALAAQAGTDEVAWMDREVLLVSAPALCAEGVLAAAAVALLDDRVRAATH